MKTKLLLQRHYSADETYVFDEDQHRATHDVAASFMFKGFLISTIDQEYFYSKTQIVDGVKQHLLTSFHPDHVHIFEDTAALVHIAQSIPRSVAICVLYMPEDGEQMRSIQLPVQVETHIDHRGVGFRSKPLDILPDIKEFEWEKELISDEKNFLGQSYKHVKELMVSKGYELDVPVLIGILRIYKGAAIDHFICDLINQTSDVDVLSAVYEAEIGTKYTRQYLGECVEALKNGKDKPEHPLKDFLPHLQDSLYLLTLTIHDSSQQLIDVIAANQKHSMGKYTAHVDMPNAVIGYTGSLLRTNKDAPQNRNYTKLCETIEVDLNPEIFYKNEPQAAIAKVKTCKKYASALLEDLELSMMDKTGFSYGSKLKREAIRRNINELHQVNDHLYVERMQLQSDLPNSRKLGIAKMNLRNMQAKLQKFDDALNAGKIKQKDYDAKATALKAKVIDLDQSISKSENEITVQVQSGLDRISQELKTNNELLDTLNIQLQEVPHDHEFARELREFLSPLSA